jgi:hypothetical protein
MLRGYCAKKKGFLQACLCNSPSAQTQTARNLVKRERENARERANAREREREREGNTRRSGLNDKLVQSRPSLREERSPKELRRERDFLLLLCFVHLSFKASKSL